MLNVSTFGNMADIYAIVHLVPHVCHVYRTPHLLLLPPSSKSGQLHVWGFRLKKEKGERKKKQQQL
jgi:hypothetical protein